MNETIILKLEQTKVVKTMKNSEAEVLFSLSTAIFPHLIVLPGFFLGHPLLYCTNIHLILVQLIIFSLFPLTNILLSDNRIKLNEIYQY